MQPEPSDRVNLLVFEKNSNNALIDMDQLIHKQKIDQTK